jgi:hypothetical protein
VQLHNVALGLPLDGDGLDQGRQSEAALAR